MDKRNFPSLSELLESPQIKGLVRTMNHSAVVTRARGFLDDLRVELQKRAPDLRDVKLPGVAEIADLIARRILAGEPSPARLVINATGVLIPNALGGAPLADEALAEV